MEQKKVWGHDSTAARNYVRDKYLRPAARSGRRSFRVVVGDVHSALGFRNRVPLVCNALTSRKFLKENALRIVERTGPPSGQSTTVSITYELLAAAPASGGDAVLNARGAARALFQALGGGEAFLQAEREAWSSRSDD